MAGFFDDQLLDVPCPGCGKEHSKSIGWIKSNSEIDCDCGSKFGLQKDSLLAELTKAEEALAQIPRKITIKF